MRNKLLKMGSFAPGAMLACSNAQHRFMSSASPEPTQREVSRIEEVPSA